MNSVSSSSSPPSSESYLVFRKPKKEELSKIFNVAKCAITQNSEWNTGISCHSDHPFSANYPCVEKSDNSIVIHWAILQLMRIYDLTFRGLKVKQDFPDQCGFTESLLCRFNIRRKIDYNSFFEHHRGEDAVKVFRLIQFESKAVLSSFSSRPAKRLRPPESESSSSSTANLGSTESESSSRPAKRLRPPESESSSSSATSLGSTESESSSNPNLALIASLETKTNVCVDRNNGNLIVMIRTNAFRKVFSIGIKSVLNQIPNELIRAYLSED